MLALRALPATAITTGTADSLTQNRQSARIGGCPTPWQDILDLAFLLRLAYARDPRSHPCENHGLTWDPAYNP